MDPHSLALTLSVGVAMGVMPLLWGTTVLCAITARRLRLNQFALQAVNYLCYPLQIILLLPFCKLGIWLFPWGTKIPSNVLHNLSHGEMAGAVNLIVLVTFKALLAWLIVAPAAGIIGYQLIRCHFDGYVIKLDI